MEEEEEDVKQDYDSTSLMVEDHATQTEDEDDGGGSICSCADYGKLRRIKQPNKCDTLYLFIFNMQCM